jgi:hypothetical protein
VSIRTASVVGAVAFVGVLSVVPIASAWQTTSDVGTLTVIADPGEANRVDIDVAPNGRISISDGAGAPRVLGPGCADPDEEGVASCDRAGIARIVVDTGDLDDAITVGELGVPIEIRTGDGNDTLSTASADDTINTGAGNDTVDAAAGNDTITTGEGDDRVSAGTGNDRVDTGVGTDTVDGDLGDDSILGSDGGDQLDGGPGADRVDGQGGDDQITGGDGDDRISAGDGTDRVTGDEGADAIDGDTGNDDLDGGNGYDVIGGGTGDDLLQSSAGGGALSGEDGNDRLEGDDTGNSLRGGTGNDIINGYGGGDVLDGEDGNDTLDGGTGPDSITGGTGTDAVTYDSAIQGVQVVLDGLANDGIVGEGDYVAADVETVTGSPMNDRIVAGAVAVTIRGGGGDDQIVGSRVSDILDGGDGNDTLDGGLGADTLAGGEGQDTVTYAARKVPVVVDVGRGRGDGRKGENDGVLPDIERVIGGAGSDALTAAPGLSVAFYGGAGSDVIAFPAVSRDDGDSTASRAVCGTGTDSVIAQGEETVGADCEIVTRDGVLTAFGVQAERSPRLSVGIERMRLDTKGVLHLPVSCAKDTYAGCNTTVLITRNRRTLGKATTVVGRGRTSTLKIPLRGSQVKTLQRAGGGVRVTLLVKDGRGKAAAATGIAAVQKTAKR